MKFHARTESFLGLDFVHECNEQIFTLKKTVVPKMFFMGKWNTPSSVDESFEPLASNMLISRHWRKFLSWWPWLSMTDLSFFCLLGMCSNWTTGWQETVCGCPFHFSGGFPVKCADGHILPNAQSECGRLNKVCKHSLSLLIIHWNWSSRPQEQLFWPCRQVFGCALFCTPRLFGVLMMSPKQTRTVGSTLIAWQW